MPIYEVQAPDGQIYDIEGPANADPKRLIDTLRRHLSSVKPAPAPSTERTALEAVTDVPASVLKGIGSMAQLPGQVYGLATGDFDTAAMRGPKKLQEYAESLKSKGLQTREALQSAAISEAAKNGIASEFLTAVTSTFKDPALISSFIAETVPQLLPALLTGGAYSALSTGARQVAKYGTKEAAEAAAAKGAARVAIGTGATQQGASVGTDTYTEALALAEKQYPNMPLEERQALALSKARAAALQSGAISVGAQFLPGGSAIERRMAGLPGEGRIRSALGESASEIVEEGGGKFASNVNLQQIDPTRSLTEGVGQAAGMGAIGGGVLGGAIGRGAPAAPLQPGQNQGENLEQTATRLQREILNAQKEITNLRQSTLPEEPADQLARANNELVALAANSQPLAIANQIQTEQAAAQAEGEQNAARFVAPTGGGSPAMAVEPTAGAAETIDGEIDRGGVVPTGPDVGVSVGGEGTAPAAVAPSYAPLLELPDVVTTFKTERGSTYAQHSDNSTTRNRSGINHLDPTTGLQLRSVKTIFLAPQDVNAIGGIFQNTEIATELVPVIKDNKPTGQVELKLTEDYGPRKAGTVLYTAPYDTTPSVGLSPVEVYSGSSPIGSAGSGVHFGNAITEVMPVAPTIKTPDVDTLATTDSAAQKPTIEVPSPGTTTSVAPILEAPTVTAPDVGRQTVTQPAPAALADVPPVETPAAATTTTEAPAVEEQKPAKVVTALNPEAQTLLEKVDQAIEVADTPQAPKGHTFNYEGRTFRIPGTPAALLKFKSTTLAKEFPESFQDTQAPAAPPVAPPAAPAAVQPTPEIKNIITGMIDDGDVESAISYADVHNVNIEDAFKGDKARLNEIQSYRQTKESLRQKPEGAQPAQGTVEAPKETLTELEARKAENTKQIEEAIAEKKKQLTQVLKAILTRMGLKDVSVKLIEDINSAEEGSYADRLMRIAVDVENPLRVLKHETVHALKELGFFTDSQWKSLTEQAKKVWIDKYLKGTNVKYNGKVMSRYDAYMLRENGDMEIIIEEAIADAFGDFSVKAPPGMLAAITARMKMLFQGIKSALNGTGFYTSDQIAEQIFTKVAKGKLKAGTQATVEAEEPAKLSLRAPKTKAFKDWFGDSKIVNKDGTPAAVYHGTKKEFSVFETKYPDGLFFFSTNPAFASKWPVGTGGKGDLREPPAGTEQEYKNIRKTEDNLYSQYMKPSDEYNFDTEEGVKQFDADRAALKAAVKKETGYSSAIEFEQNAGVNVMPVYLSIQKPFDPRTDYRKIEKFLAKEGKQNLVDKEYHKSGNWVIYEDKGVIDELKRQGYDGIWLAENIGGPHETIAAFSNTQIKSAIGNVGTYSKTNPDIRYSLRNKTVNLNGRDIPVVLHALDKKRGDVLVPVKTKAFDDAWEASDKYKSFYIGAKGTGNAIKDRYERFAKFSVTAKNIEASSVSVDEDGNVGFGDGRHRWSFMRDQGVPVIPVAMSPESLKNAEKFGYVAKSGDKAKFSLRSTLPQSTQASIDRITTAREEKGFIGRMMEAIAPTAFSKYRQQYLNRYNQLGRYDKMLADLLGVPGLLADASAEAAALMSDNGAGLTASALGVHDRVGGIPVFRNGVTIISNVNGTVAGPMKIFAKLTELGKGDSYIYQSYQLWAGAKRASRFNAQGIDTPYTAADLQEAKRLEGIYPEFVEIQKDWIKYNDGLVQYMLDTGIISKENAKKFVEHSDYIPFYRQLDGEETIGPKIFQSISGVKPPRKLKGNKEAPLADFMETVVRNTQSVIQAGLKNTAAKQAVNVAMQLGPNFIVPLGHVSQDPSDVMVLEKGLKKYYRSSDPLWIESLKALNAADLPFNALISGPANLLRTMVTKDPGFMLANMMRDSLAAHVTSGIKMTPIVDTIKNFTAAIAGQSPEFKTLLNAGLLGGYEFSQNIEYSGKVLEKELRKKTGTTTTTEKVLSPFTGLWSALEKGTTASDAATRIEVYKKTLAETGNEAEALFRAMEVMNFNRKGNSPVIRVITAAIPFLNARIQGLDVLYRAGFGQLNSQDAAKVQRLFFIRGAQMMALSGMYWLLTHDDDEYKKQESETRDNYWLLPSLGIKIPIPFEIGILFKVIPERILAYSFGDDTGQDFMKSMARQLSSTLAVNPIPQAALPIVEAVTNHSFFTQRPIVGQGMEGVAPGYQVGPGTTNVAADIGKALNISPMKLDHMIKGYTGTIGMYLMDVVDSVYSMNSDIDKPSKRIDQLPVLKRFLIDPEARGTVTAFYEMKNAADQVVRTESLLERTFKFDARADYLQENGKMLVAEEYVKTLEKTMKQFREMKLMIRSSNMPSDDKRDALSQITAAENRLTSNIQAMKKALQ